MDLQLGNYATAIAAADECLQVAAEQGRDHIGNLCADTRAIILATVGLVTDAESILRNLLSRPSVTSDSYSIAIDLCHIGTIRRRTGDYSDAKNFYDRALAASNIKSSPHAYLTCAANREFTQAMLDAQ